MPRIIEEIEFRNPSRARDQLNRLAGGLPEVIVARIQVLLASVPDPDQSLHFLERLRIENPGGFDRLSNSPTALSYLITIFSYSKFLSETVLRYPEWLLQLVVSGELHHVLSAEEYEDRLAAFLLDHGTGPDAVPPPIDLARFRRQQLLRIVLRDVLGLGSLADVTEELSNLADAVLDLTYRRIRAELVLCHGVPQMIDGRGHQSECGFSVIGWG